MNTLLQDARRHGVRVRPVCVVESGVRTAVLADGSLRLGLQRLKGLSAGTMGRLVAAREVAAFGSVEDLVRRVGPTLKEWRVMAEAGALNALPEVGHRQQAMWQVELPFHGDLLTDAGNDDARVLSAMTVGERVAADFSVQGATTGPHPLRLWRENSGTWGVQRARDLAVLPTGAVAYSSVRGILSDDWRIYGFCGGPLTA